MSAGAAPGLDLERISQTLQSLIERSGRQVTTLDHATGVVEPVSTELAADPSGLLPMFLMAAETVWRDATGKGFGVELQPDGHALMGHRAASVAGGSFSAVMLSMMEAIEQVATQTEIPGHEMLDRWHETMERLAPDTRPQDQQPAAPAPAPGASR